MQIIFALTEELADKSRNLSNSCLVGKCVVSPSLTVTTPNHLIVSKSLSLSIYWFTYFKVDRRSEAVVLRLGSKNNMRIDSSRLRCGSFLLRFTGEVFEMDLWHLFQCSSNGLTRGGFFARFSQHFKFTRKFGTVQ